MRVVLALLLLAGAAAWALHAWTEKSIRTQTQYDPLIQPVAVKLNLDPLLVRAIIWRESRFQPLVRGLNKEKGLMQVTPGVAAEWAERHHVEPIDPDALFDPETNIEIGSWYFARMLSHWSETDNPAGFALAEYNAGRSNALRWVDPEQPASFAAFSSRIAFGSTKRYVFAILQKHADYQRGYFRPPWLAWWDRVTRRADAPTLVGPAANAN